MDVATGTVHSCAGCFREVSGIVNKRGERENEQRKT